MGKTQLTESRPGNVTRQRLLLPRTIRNVRIVCFVAATAMTAVIFGSQLGIAAHYLAMAGAPVQDQQAMPSDGATPMASADAAPLAAY